MAYVRQTGRRVMEWCAALLLLDAALADWANVRGTAAIDLKALAVVLATVLVTVGLPLWTAGWRQERKEAPRPYRMTR